MTHAEQAHLRTLAETRADDRLAKHDGDQLTQAEITLAVVAGAVQAGDLARAAIYLNAYHGATGCQCQVTP